MKPDIQISDFVEPSFGENAYVVWIEAGGPGWIVDPGPPPSARQILEHLAAHRIVPEALGSPGQIPEPRAPDEVKSP